MSVTVISKLAIQGGADSPIIDASAAKNGFAVVANTTERGNVLASVKAGNGFMVWRLDGGAGTGGLELWNGSSWSAISFGSSGSGGGGMGFPFTYSTTTADADPGAGTFRGNNATLANSTKLFIDDLESGGTTVSSWLATWDDAITNGKGTVRLQSKSDPTKWLEFPITAYTAASGYSKIDVGTSRGPGGILTTAGDTQVIFDAGASGDKIVGIKTISYTETDDGNSSTADTIDWSAGSLHKSTLTGNCTYTFTAPPAYTAIQLRVIQDATGGRTVTWPGSVLWDVGYAPVLAGGPNTEVIISGYYDGTNYKLINPDKSTRIVTESTTARTTSATDANALIDCTNGSATAVTIAPDSSVPQPIGTTHLVRQGGAGQVTIAAGAGVTINTALTLKTLQQYAVIGVIKTAANNWTAFGLLAYS